MERPKIQVAIPQRRYQLGSYQAVVLGEIESGDERRYQYILALVRQDETQPGFYVTAEKNPRAHAHEGAYRLRVVVRELVKGRMTALSRPVELPVPAAQN